MEEENGLTLKGIIKVLLGNKWIYLLMVGFFLIGSAIGLSIYSSRESEYVALFDYDVAGFSTIVDDNGNVEAKFIDGEKFNPRSLVTKEKIREIFANSEELKHLNVDSLYEANLVKSFEYSIKYVKNDHQKDGNDAAYIENKRGYELVLNPKCLNKAQAKTLTEAIANEVIRISSIKIDKIQYRSYLNYFDSTNSYPDKISSLNSGINYLKDLSNTLVEEYGDVILTEGNYGGEEEKYHLDSKSISSWQKQLDIVFDSYYVDSLSSEQEINGYISEDSNTYVESLRSTIANLSKQVEVDTLVLEDLKAQRKTLIETLGTDVTIESVEIGEYNGEIISLTKKIAEENQLLEMYELQLKKLDPSSFSSPEERELYYSNLLHFNDKLSSIRENLEFFTNQYEAIAKATMKNELRVYFDSPEVVTTQGNIKAVVIAGSSLAIGLFAPMVVNLCFAAFKTADGKPILNFKKKN